MNPRFIESDGGTVIDMMTGETVVSINVNAISIDEARLAMDVILAALEASFPRKPQE